ncbi:MAG: hypothetical protein QOG68_1044, partial [Solirubrobacteraceae bacterium]|nr:hypothetical protein [Solirubrobacteraceae bacterium]
MTRGVEFWVAAAMAAGVAALVCPVAGAGGPP